MPGRPPLTPKSQSSFATLRRFVRERPPGEQCEICGVGLSLDHPHLFEPARRQVLCACEACAISLGSQADAKYRRIPHSIRSLPNFRLTEAQWDSLLIPVGMAFFFYSSPAKRMMALYPSPAGAMESLLELETWQELVRDNPILTGLEPDVEGLLVNRVRGAEEYYLAPIDRCYELVGLIRAHWRGLGGGSVVWEEIGKFFAALKQRSSPAREAEGARA